MELLAQAVNALNDLRWFQSEDGTKKPPRNRPELILPPWQKPPVDPGKETFGNARMTLEETRAWLGW